LTSYDIIQALAYSNFFRSRMSSTALIYPKEQSIP
jgi:hypothetical protein